MKQTKGVTKKLEYKNYLVIAVIAFAVLVALTSVVAADGDRGHSGGPFFALWRAIGALSERLDDAVSRLEVEMSKLFETLAYLMHPEV